MEVPRYGRRRAATRTNLCKERGGQMIDRLIPPLSIHVSKLDKQPREVRDFPVIEPVLSRGETIFSSPQECVECGSPDVRRCIRQGFQEWILKRFRIVPWRCMNCGWRFYG